MSTSLIITGMHRSGTSLLASLVQALGINVGDNLYRADDFNVRGYFEDVDFLEFQRRVLQNSCRQDDGGWIDWGWTENESLNYDKFKEYLGEAKALIEQRNQRFSVWGWKEPRTSLMLDFWQELLPEARYLLVYRLPWDVADSILRLNAQVFQEHPDYPLRIWRYYNRHLLDFYQRFPDKCILVNINSLLQKPEKLIELLETKLNLQVNLEGNNLEKIYDSSLFKSLGNQHPVVQLLKEVSPESLALLTDLDSKADIPSDFSLGNLKESLPAEGSVMQLHQLDLVQNQEINKMRQEIAEIQQEIQKLKAAKRWHFSESLSKWKKLLPL